MLLEVFLSLYKTVSKSMFLCFTSFWSTKDKACVLRFASLLITTLVILITHEQDLPFVSSSTSDSCFWTRREICAPRLDLLSFRCYNDQNHGTKIFFKDIQASKQKIKLIFKILIILVSPQLQ